MVKLRRKDDAIMIAQKGVCPRRIMMTVTELHRKYSERRKTFYQCLECKHTLNLTVYERRKATSIPKEEYHCFLDNDEQLAERYGKNMQLFRANKADIDFDRLHYDLVKLHETMESSGLGEQMVITVMNPHRLKIHLEKQIAMVLGLSRNQVKSLLQKEEIEIKMELPQSVSFSISPCLFPMDT